jgi:hypothetical protein
MAPEGQPPSARREEPKATTKWCPKRLSESGWQGAAIVSNRGSQIGWTASGQTRLLASAPCPTPRDHGSITFRPRPMLRRPTARRHPIVTCCLSALFPDSDWRRRSKDAVASACSWSKVAHAENQFLGAGDLADPQQIGLRRFTGRRQQFVVTAEVGQHLELVARAGPVEIFLNAQTQIERPLGGVVQ